MHLNGPGIKGAVPLLELWQPEQVVASIASTSSGWSVPASPRCDGRGLVPLCHTLHCTASVTSRAMKGALGAGRGPRRAARLKEGGHLVSEWAELQESKPYSIKYGPQLPDSRSCCMREAATLRVLPPLVRLAMR